jgi:hypothetical protein
MVANIDITEIWDATQCRLGRRIRIGWRKLLILTARYKIIFFTMAQHLILGQDLLIIEVSQSHSDTPHSVELLWTSDHPDADDSTWKHITLIRDRHPFPLPPGFDSTIPAIEQQQTHAFRQRGRWTRQKMNRASYSEKLVGLHVYQITRCYNAGCRNLDRYFT